MSQTIDLSGLPEPVVHDIQQLVESIRQNVERPMETVTPSGPNDKLALFEAWLQGHRPSPVIADDSRESIYSGRGE